MTETTYTYTIIGAGAIGGVIGAYLARSGHSVEFIDVVEEHVKRINESGITIQLKEETFSVPVQAYTMEEFIQLNRKITHGILAVKALHTDSAISTIYPNVVDDGYIASFQNGLNEQLIASYIGENRTLGCFINLFADYIEPGTISYGGEGALYIGELNGQITPRIEKLMTDLKSWGNAKTTTNIEGYLWSKLAYGAILTATATSNIQIADFFDSKEYRGLLFAIGKEILQVAEAKSITPEEFDDWDPSIIMSAEPGAEPFTQLTKRLRGYTKTRTGIWRDLAVRKRKTEVPEQLLPVIEMGESYGLNMSLTKKIVEMILEIENGKREQSEENLLELKQLI